MTSQTNPLSSNRSIRFGLLGLSGLAVVAACGCESAAPPPPPPVAKAPPPPPPPSRPKVTPISELMAQMGIDERVRLPEDLAPRTNDQRRAVLSFFDAFARGDDQSVMGMVGKLEQGELAELVASGEWQRTVEQISYIDVQTGKGPDGPVALAIFAVDLDFQPQLWYFDATPRDTSFQAVATPPDIMDRLSGDDWISAWFDLIGEELAMADAPDVTEQLRQRDMTEAPTSTGPSMGPTGPGRGPGVPGKRPKPKGPKRRPPGPPG